MTIIQRKRRVVAVLDWVADRFSTANWLMLFLAAMVASAAGLTIAMGAATAPKNLDVIVGFVILLVAFAYYAGRLRSDVLEQRQHAEILRLKRLLGHDQRTATDATQAMRPVDQAELEPRGASDLTTVLPAIRSEEADRG